jgi:hypothetical protein
LATVDDTLGFEHDIKPLFRDRDRESMMRVAQFDLWAYDDVRQRAAEILGAVTSGKMPCDGAWPADRVQTFQRWTETGMAP